MRCTRWALSAFLPLLGSAALLWPAPAEAQTTIWSATLTVDVSSNGNNGGCSSSPADGIDNCSTALSNDNFVYNGTTYTIRQVSVSRGGRRNPNRRELYFGLTATIPSSLRSNATLTFGTTVLPFSSAVFIGVNPANSTAELSLTDGSTLPWTDNQEVTVSLTVPPPTLSASNITETSATLTRTHHSGTWYYKANAAPHNTCSAAQTGNTVNLMGLSPSTSYTYKMYSDSSCGTEITSATTDAEFDTLLLAPTGFTNGLSVSLKYNTVQLDGPTETVLTKTADFVNEGLLEAIYIGLNPPTQLACAAGATLEFGWYRSTALTTRLGTGTVVSTLQAREYVSSYTPPPAASTGRWPIARWAPPTRRRPTCWAPTAR